jgi:hypothetical protein
LQCGALFLGEGVEHTLHPQHAFLLFEFFVGMRGVESDLGGRGVQWKMAGVLFLGTIDGQMATDGQTVAFQIDGARNVLATFPHTHQCVFDHILGFEAVERDAQRYPVKFVLQGKQIMLEIYFIHASI